MKAVTAPSSRDSVHEATRESSRHVSSKIIAGQRLVHGWERIQVELNGHFSIQRIEDMRDYCRRTSLLRVLLLGLSAPIPALLVIILQDCVPLASPEDGTVGNFVYWIRLVPSLQIMVACVVQHFRCCLPALVMTNMELFLVAFAGAIAGVSFGFGVSFFVGFPVPFNLVIQSVTVFPVIVIALRFLWRQSLHGNPTLQADLRRQVFVLFGQAAITYVFPIYFFAFTTMPPLGQSAFTLVLPMIKLGMKNYFSRGLHRLDDLKPAFVVLNVDVFSALYVANCLQASQSRINTLLICFVDIAQLAISVYDLRVMLKEIRSLVQLDKFDGSLLDLCLLASKLTGVREDLDRRTSSVRVLSANKSRTNVLRNGRVVALSGATQPKLPSADTVHEALLAAGLKPTDAVELIHRIARLLYMIEFFLLVEFIEVVIPVVFCIYMVAMSHLPNQDFYPQLAALTSAELLHSITTVMSNAALEFLSFIFIVWVIQRELNFSSPRLLSFALETQQAIVHSSLIIWILYVIQQPLAHSGIDFSLRFAWLSKKSGA